jgi:hypothetical protein
MDLKEEEILGPATRRHWYYVSKGAAMRDFLGNIKVKESLDVGAGSGIFSRQLLDYNICNSAVCVDPFYSEKKRVEYHNGKPIKFVTSVKKVSQNLILMMDVLEHVDDDVALLKQFSDPMSKEGKILITVPAFQFLWSGHDVFLEHKRRYTMRSLERIIYKAGLEPIKMNYFFGFMFPAVAAIRTTNRLLVEHDKIEAKSHLVMHPKWLNKLFISIHDIERKSLFRINKLAGLSIFCLCKR